MEFGKRHDTTDTTDFSRANFLRTCYGFATGKLL